MIFHMLLLQYIFVSIYVFVEDKCPRAIREQKKEQTGTPNGSPNGAQIDKQEMEIVSFFLNDFEAVWDPPPPGATTNTPASRSRGGVGGGINPSPLGV